MIKMTLREWHDFNEPVLGIGTWVVCILKSGSYKRDDTILEARMDCDNAVSMFGKFELKRVQLSSDEDDCPRTLRVLLWANVEKPEEA